MVESEMIITVMPDYGLGPYAWEKPVSDQTPYVGLCVATAVDKLETEDGTTITDELHAEFVAWTGEFEQFAARSDFDWKAFHARGAFLSRRLKLELGHRFRVVYHKPFEDPEHEVNAYVEITASAA
jgi:hypothetical protein